MTAESILLTGATGYVGGRLLERLSMTQHKVRCLVRDPQRLVGRPGSQAAQIVVGDVLDAGSLQGAFDGITVLFYLVHSMGSTTGFEAADRVAVDNVIAEARRAGVRRIVYLGGLGREGDADSPHLRSRHEVGALLRGSGIPTLEFRASIVIGPGSLSFDLVRSLVERLPVMITPRWVRSLAQPIYIDDVLSYLLAAIDTEATRGVLEIGGPDRVSYSDLLLQYARQRKLRRWVIHVPLLTARLSSLWLGLVTPVYARVGRKLIDSLRHDTVVEDDRAARQFPDIHPRGVAEAMALAIENEEAAILSTRWMDALSASVQAPSWRGQSWARRRIDSRAIHIAAVPGVVWEAVRRIGGRRGYYYGDWLWQMRGAIDLLFGGAGMRRGRRDPRQLLPGDTVDFWRVEAVEPERLLRLTAEMRLPGRAWLQFELQAEEGGTCLRQTAIYDPRGAMGILYWWSVAPLHHLVFGGMLRGLAEAAAAGVPPSAGTEPPPTALTECPA